MRLRVDSLRKALGGSSADVAAQIAAADVMEEVRATQQADEAQALALLTEAQRPKAAEVLQEEREAQRRAGRGPDAMSRDQDLGRGYGRTRTRP